MAMAFLAEIMLAALIFPTPMVLCGFPMTLTLEKSIPPSHQLELSQLRARDAARHGRLLQSVGGVVDFPVSGTYNPFLVG
ncbi:hypothetical protein SLE2022_397540 [Rubroshorea leprosula]